MALYNAEPFGGGALTQLAAGGGGMSSYLTASPAVTFWKDYYLRHTPFALGTYPVVVDGGYYGDYGRYGDIGYGYIY